MTSDTIVDIPIEELYSHPVVQQLLSKLDNDLDTSVKIPYTLKNKVLMSPGVWNGYFYSSDAIKDAFLKSKWNLKEVRSLFLDHEDLKSGEWIGEVVNPHLESDTILGDLVIVDKPTAIKLAYGAKMGVSPKVSGQEEEGKMASFTFDNFSVVINPAVKTAYINNSQKAEKEVGRKNDEEVIKMADEKVEQTAELAKAPEAPVTTANIASTEPVSTINKETVENADDIVEVLASVSDIAKKAKEIRKKYPDMKWTDAIKKAAKEMSEAPKEMSDEDILTAAVEILQKKKYPIPPCAAAEKKSPYPEEVAEKKKYPYPEEIQKVNEQLAEKDKTIVEMSERLKKVEQKLNEPDRASAKTEEMSQSIADPDMAFMDMLKGI